MFKKALMTLIPVMSLACATTSFAHPPPDDPEIAPLRERVKKATVLISKGENSDKSFQCSGLGFERDEKEKVQRFIAGAHCVAKDDVKHKRVRIAGKKWYIHYDEPGVQRYIPVQIIAGYQMRGDDILILEASLEDLKGMDAPVVPLASAMPVEGERVISYANPHGYGKRYFEGYVSLQDIDRPLQDSKAQINWEHAMIVEINGWRGSSGAALVSVSKKAVVGIFVGFTLSGGSAFVMPVRRIREFLDLVKHGKYPWFDPEESFNAGDND